MRPYLARWKADPDLHHYQACGFAISSDLPLPMVAVERADGAQLRIVQGPVPDEAGDPIGPFARAGTDWLAFAVPGVVRFHVTAGAIIWQPEAATDQGSVATFVLNSALPCAAMLAGYAPLRSTSVDVGERTLLLLGPPAAGKSALAAELVLRGHSLRSDGFSLVNGAGAVLGGVSTLTLARDAATALGLDTGGLAPTRPGLARFHWLQPLPSPTRPASALYRKLPASPWNMHLNSDRK